MEPWMIVVILGAAAIVYALMLPKRQVNKTADKEQMVREVEATLEQYMADIERENEELVELIGQMKQDMTSRQLAQQEQLAEMRQRLVQLEQQHTQAETRLSEVEQGNRLAASASALGTQQETAAAAQESGQSAANDTETGQEEAKQPSIRDRYPELFELHAQGKSMEAIAKFTGLQKGEVQLILQLAKREGSL
ncbi:MULTISPECIES: hypothetical protein [Paenibacillus]|uniref:DUF2802 domain-containing protein n=1 Tax=Paenibacillus albilobatus TaxID=2716884 RepID=A0A919XGI5_9BACL|nr:MULTISPECIES: hypothetical protein [Paenibacillus]GIO29973.1 hypothetical protein J2TS6_11140 [Paenibacillus albilobatus]